MSLRLASRDDQPAIGRLIEASVRALSVGHYSSEQIEGALETAMGTDTQLIDDETYYVVEHAGEIVACGGWSFRQTLFGNDGEAARDTSVTDPATGAARIRAFFVSPAHARQGLGSMLMRHCEAQARERGYRLLELMATSPGRALYERHGFIAGESILYELRPGLGIEFIPMKKGL